MPIKCRYGQNYQTSLQHLPLSLRKKIDGETYTFPAVSLLL